MDPRELLFRSLLMPSHVQYAQESADEPLFQGDEYTNLPLFEEQDKLIVMHRDAHFGGSFSAMRLYYEQEDSVGINEEIDPTRIVALETLQDQLGRDLAPILVTGSDAEKVARSREMYRHFRQLLSDDPSSVEAALAALIVSEDPTALLAADPKLLEKPQELVLVATSEELRDPLFPGYGLAPMHAVQLLGRLRYEPAIVPLFYLIGEGDFEMEGAVLSALRSIGEASKQFLRKQLIARPLTKDNERAALALLEFLPNEEISALFREQILLVDDERLLEYLHLGEE